HPRRACLAREPVRSSPEHHARAAGSLGRSTVGPAALDVEHHRASVVPRAVAPARVRGQDPPAGEAVLAALGERPGGGNHRGGGNRGWGGGRGGEGEEGGGPAAGEGRPPGPPADRLGENGGAHHGWAAAGAPVAGDVVPTPGAGTGSNSASTNSCGSNGRRS